MNEITINPNRIDLDEAYLQMAEVWARRSKGNRLQVGCLIVKDKQIISDGYNGMPAGDNDDTCEFFTNGVDASQGLSTKHEVLHAESNALAKIAENGGVGAQGATLYVTMSPCKECAKLIKQSKIQRVVFRELYRDGDGIEFLLQRGVQVEQLQVANQPPTALQPKETQQPKAADTARLGMLQSITNRPMPVERPKVAAPAPQVTEVAPPVEAVPVAEPVVASNAEPVFIDDVAAALAAAGISLDDGVPVERPSQVKKTVDNDPGYVSSFL